MATKTTIEMAREAAGDDWGLFQEYMPEIHKLTELVRADERARMVEQEPVAWEQFYPEMGKPKLAYLPPTESPENACYIPPAQQKPVAWYDSKTGWTDFHPFKPARKPSAPDAEWLPLYTSPPAQRTWVGLTESEKSAALYDKDGMTLDYEDYAEALEAKLKEKNT